MSRRHESQVPIYQDHPAGMDDTHKTTSPQHHQPLNNQIDSHFAHAYFNPFDPPQAATYHHQQLLQSSHPTISGMSPLKRRHSQHTTTNQLHMHAMDQSFFPPLTDIVPPSLPPMKKYNRTYHSVAPKLPPQVVFKTSRAFDQENFIESSAEYSELTSEPTYDLHQYSLGKHPLTEITDSSTNAKRQKTEVEEDFIIPDPEDLPEVVDEGGKPPYSYAQLIAMAILRAPNRRLTLSQIYKWISDTFEFYQTSDSGWTNSIRHNLSLNKAFIKKERPKDDPGKGNYWAIVEGLERQFLKDKKSSKPTDLPSYFNPNEASKASFDAFSMAPRPTRAIDSTKFSAGPDVSSDATLPASDDVATQETGSKNHEEAEEQDLPPPSSASIRSSPPPANMNSSPPIARRTPPPVPRFPSPRPRSGHARKSADPKFADSGFFSSLGASSATRPHAGPPSEQTRAAEQRRAAVKRGRAEEEIARLRGSSFDPSPRPYKVRGHKSTSSINININSSPTRFDRSYAPLTPGLKFKPIAIPPPTVSPNTHLQRHRDAVRALIGTPAANLKQTKGYTPAMTTWKSPAFMLHDDGVTQRGLLQSQLHHKSPEKYHEDEYLYNLQLFRQDEQRSESEGSTTKHSVSALFKPEDFASFFSPVHDQSPLKHRSKMRQPCTALKRASTTFDVAEDTMRTRSQRRLRSPFSPVDSNKGKASVSLDSPTKKRRLSSPDQVALYEGILENSDDDEEDDDYHPATPFNEEDEEEAPLDLSKGFGKIGELKKGKENANVQASKRVAPSVSRPVFGRSVTNVL